MENYEIENTKEIFSLFNAASKDPTRAFLENVWFSNDGYAYASDGHVLAARKHNVELKRENFPVSKEIAKELSKIKYPITMEVTDSSVNIACPALKRSWSCEAQSYGTMPAFGKLDPNKIEATDFIGVNLDLVDRVKKALAMPKNKAHVKIEMQGKLSPIRITPKDKSNDSPYGLVMPMRLN